MQAAQERRARDNAFPIRDAFLGAFLFCATAAFCVWQNTRVAALFDLSYLLDTSWRIALGQLPYRDFPFAHAPGTFLLHAAIIKIFGRVYWPHIACAAIESGAATLLTWRILLHVMQPFGERTRRIGALLAAALVPLGIYSVYPHAIYDGDCIFAVLVALYLVVWAAEGWDGEGQRGDASVAARSMATRNLVAGAACIVPVFFKQNIGLAFLAAILVGVAVIAVAHAARRKSGMPQIWFLGGILSTVIVALFAIQATVGLGNYWHWTMTFAGQRRLPGVATILEVYHQASLLWTVPVAMAGYLLSGANRSARGRWRRIIALMLLVAPFLWTLIQFFLTSDADDRGDALLSLWPHLLVVSCVFAVAQIVRVARGRVTAVSALLPMVLMATIHGAFLSQQLWGSTYAIWPLLMLLIGLMMMEVREAATPLTLVISAVLLFCGGTYAVSLERLEYIHLDGPALRATLAALRGMATPGPWLPEFENMVRFTDAEIPRGDGVVLIPGEEPFYFATGRVPQFPILLTDLATDPYTPQQTAAEMRARNIRWLIVRRDLQLTAPPEYETPELLRTVEQGFALYRTIPGYDVYRRK